MGPQNSYTGINGYSSYATPSYNTVYPTSGYSGMNTPTVYQNTPQQQQVKSERVWVQGESSAKAFIVANNTEQTLWDAEQPVIYLKTVDAYGKPSMVILDYTIRKQETPKAIDSDMDALRAEVSDLKMLISDLIETSKSKNNYKQNPNYKQKNNGGDE